MTSKTYCVSWDRVYDNSLDVSAQLDKAGLDYLIYNDSSHPNLNNNWVRAKKIFFLGHFYNSLKDFASTSHSVFAFNAGDAVYKDQAGLIKKAEKLLSVDPDCWVYAPCAEPSDSWSWEGSSIQESELYPGLVLSTHSNLIWVALSRELALLVLDFYEWMFENGYFDRDFKTINTGWGMDSFFCAITLALNKKIYRDWKCIVTHTSDTSYSHLKAMQEMKMAVYKSINFAKEIGIDSEKMLYLYNLIYRKHRTKEPLSLNMVYSSLEDLKDFRI